MSASSTNIITLKNNTGNLRLNGDFVLNSVNDTIELIFDSATNWWKEISRTSASVKTLSGERSVLSSTFTVNNTATLADTGLSVPVLANNKYAFRGALWVASGATPGFKITAVLSGTGSGGWTSNHASSGTAQTNLGTAVTATGSTTDRIIEFVGFITPTADCNLKIQFAQNTADGSNSSVYASSWLEVFK
jgi:hypothetical protein